MSSISILSLDGGGVKGILSGLILRYLEEKIQEKEGKNIRLSDYFDFMAGTSTGGLLISGLLVPNAEGRPKYTTQEVLDFYLKESKRIFSRSSKYRFKSMGGLLNDKFDSKTLEEVLKHYLGEVYLNELLKPCLLTTYDIINRKALFFNSVKAKGDISNFKIRDIIRAASAAPSYFEPARIKSVFGTPYTLIDGGVFASNPGMCAYAEARSLDFAHIFNNPEKPTYPGVKDMLFISIGTGKNNTYHQYEKFKNKGLINWIRPIIDIMLSSNSGTVHYQLKQMFSTVEKGESKGYFRLQPPLLNGRSTIDDASSENLHALYEDGLSFIANNIEKFDTIIDKIIKNKS